MRFKMTLQVEGHVEKELTIWPIAGCGKILDGEGVSFAHGKEDVWVIRFEELEKVVEVCRLARKK